MNRSLAYVDVFELDPEAGPADLISGFNPKRDSFEAKPLSADELFDRSNLSGELAESIQALQEAYKADPNG